MELLLPKLEAHSEFLEVEIPDTTVSSGKPDHYPILDINNNNNNNKYKYKYKYKQQQQHQF